jgi:hypothetical protein
MTTRIHVNNFSTTIDGGITDVATSVDLTSVTGFPAIGGGVTCNLTLQSGSTIEIITATARSGNTLTITRAQEGTSAVAWSDLTVIGIRPTADSVDRKLDITSTTATPTASTVSKWDANINLSANNHLQGYATTATAAGTTTLTVASAQTQTFTGSTTQTCRLPVTSTLVLGFTFTIQNLSSGVVTVESSGSNAIQALAANTGITVRCIATSGTGTSSWQWHYYRIQSGQIVLTTDVTGTLPIANGGTAVTSATTTPTASSFAAWDANNNFSADNFLAGYTTTATAAGTTTLTVDSTRTQIFTGSTTQTVTLPVVSTLALGTSYIITNLSSGVVTVQSSGANSIQAMQANSTLIVVSNATSGTGAAVWYVVEYVPAASSQTGSGSLVRATSPALVTPTLGTPASGALINCTAGSPTYFLANRTTAQSITSATFTKMQLTNEVVDSAGTFDPVTNYRHTPTTAGKYFYTGMVSIANTTDQKQLYAGIYKNGAAVLNGINYLSSGSASSVYTFVGGVVDMNGTTDYVELYIYQDGGTLNTLADGSKNYLTGILLI